MLNVYATVHLVDGRTLDLFDWAIQIVCARHEPFGELQVSYCFLVCIQHNQSASSL